MHLPKVSIITPNYNYGQYIGKCIESVLGQDYDNIEHIIIDDGSTDNSVEVISSYVTKYPNRIKFIKQNNQGQSVAINVGFKCATGEMIGWINSDDIFTANAIRSLINPMLDRKDIDIVFGDYILIDEVKGSNKKVKQLPMDKKLASMVGFANLVASNTVLWRKSLFEITGYLNEEFKYNMDGDFFSRLFNSGCSIHINAYVAYFRVHHSSKTADSSKEKQQRFNYEYYFEIKKSYSKLPISKLIPYEFSYPLKFIFKTRRVLRRLIRGHYF